MTSDIVIVDDNPSNLKLLEEMLQMKGHRVRSFPLGRLAIAASRKNPPSLILLDVNMPEMNGYEVCEILKSTPDLTDTPVIFLSALHETTDKVRAFRCGAADYITKPFQMEEVHSRVETHLELFNLQRALRQQNERLEEAVAKRTRELSEANARLTILDRSKNDFLTLISHEFRTPLNGLLGVCEIILAQRSNPEDKRLQQVYQRSRTRILSILDDAILLTEIDVNGQRFKPAFVPIHSAINAAIDETRHFAAHRQIGLTLLPEGLEPFLTDVVLGDETLLARALQALIETALKFAGKDTVVGISRKECPGKLELAMETVGLTIPESALDKFFEILNIGDAITPGGDLGLRPAVAQRILALYNATVTVENVNEQGVRLTVSFQTASSG